jgi:hypothetical protein
MWHRQRPIGLFYCSVQRNNDQTALREARETTRDTKPLIATPNASKLGMYEYKSNYEW